MRTTDQRLALLRMMLDTMVLNSQEEILQQLHVRGYDISQATLSKDLRQLRVAKVTSGKGYRYVMPYNELYRRQQLGKEPSPAGAKGFVNICFGSAIAVIKTLPGYASAIARDIDEADIDNILGTIAGSDTVFVALAEGTDRQALLNELAETIPGVLTRADENKEQH